MTAYFCFWGGVGCATFCHSWNSVCSLFCIKYVHTDGWENALMQQKFLRQDFPFLLPWIILQSSFKSNTLWNWCIQCLFSYIAIQRVHPTQARHRTKEVEHCCLYKTNWTNVSFLAINPYKSKPAGIPSLAWQKRLTRWKLKISTLLPTGYWTSSHPKSVFDIGSNPFSGSFLTCPINQAQIGFQITFDWISCQ